MKKRILAAIILLFSIFCACNRKDLWENKYSNHNPVLPDVNSATYSSGNEFIMMSWIDPAVSFDAIEITWTDGIMSSIDTVMPSVQNYTITGLTESTAYTLIVRVTDSTGNTSPGITATITTTSPVTLPDINSITYTAGNDFIVLNWIDPAAAFNVIEITWTDGVFSWIDTAMPSVQTYTITGLADSTTYTITITVTDSFGNTSPGIITTLTTTTPVTLPDVTLTSLTADSSAAITLTWTDPVAGFDFIEISWTGGPNGNYNASPGDLTYTISGLSPGTTYDITIIVTDSLANTSPGISLSITTPASATIAGHFIYTADDLNAVRGGVYAGWDISDTYYLMADIDLSTYNSGDWPPIGDDIIVFSGNFEGNGHTISNMTVSDSTWYLALFGNVSGMVRNLILLDPNVNGTGYLGTVAGYNSGTIEGCSVTVTLPGYGTVTGSSENIGGLVGFNGGTIDNCSSAAEITASSSTATYVGGLSGQNYDTILNSYATGNINAAVANHNHAGGLVGRNYIGTIDNCHATGNVNGYYCAGGLVGWNYGSGGTINNSYATGIVEGYSSAGGLVGFNSGSASVTFSFATGKVTAANQWGGGLAGHISSGAIEQCFASGNVFGGGLLGGFAGSVESGSIYNCYARGEVDGITDYFGGFAGNLYASTTENCYSTGTIVNKTVTHYGGFAGFNDGSTVTYCFYDAETTGCSGEPGFGRTNEQMTPDTISNIFSDVGWDFTTIPIPVWSIDTTGINDYYPYLYARPPL
ncbi:MAG: hypothetical protein JXN64_11915 [Spirochaetes bacterium]|nr:hypothetical protein [Spirochaetota bacterium]